MARKEVVFYSRGQKVDGILDLPSKRTNKIIIMCHGLASNKNNKFFVKASKEFCRHNLATFRFDFRGSGKSEGEFCGIGGEADDLIAAIDFIKGYQDGKFKKMGLLGISLGAAVIIHAGNSDKEIPCVLINPALSAVEIFKHMISSPIWWYFAGRFNKYKRKANQIKKGLKDVELAGAYNDFRFRLGKLFFHDVVYRLRCIAKKILFIQSSDDGLVNEEITREIFSKVKTKAKKLVMIKHGDHALSKGFASHMAINASIEWFEKWLK